jgi:flavin-dependent dehydrogenase
MGRELRADYTLDCTGRAARLALEFGAERLLHDKLVATWAILGVGVDEPDRGPTSRDDDRHTYIEATVDGWWYATRIPGRRRVVAFFTDGDLLDHRLMRSAGGFVASLKKAPHLSELAPWSQYTVLVGPSCLPAMSMQLRCAYGPAWIAAGDAAQCFDPLSSQGILTAILGGNNAAAALVARQGADRDAFANYQSVLDRSYADYLKERHDHYAAESRWKDNVFWRRRHEGPSRLVM